MTEMTEMVRDLRITRNWRDACAAAFVVTLVLSVVSLAVLAASYDRLRQRHLKLEAQQSSWELAAAAERENAELLRADLVKLERELLSARIRASDAHTRVDLAKQQARIAAAGADREIEGAYFEAKRAKLQTADWQMIVKFEQIASKFCADIAGMYLEELKRVNSEGTMTNWSELDRRRRRRLEQAQEEGRRLSVH